MTWIDAGSESVSVQHYVPAGCDVLVSSRYGGADYHQFTEFRLEGTAARETMINREQTEAHFRFSATSNDRLLTIIARFGAPIRKRAAKMEPPRRSTTIISKNDGSRWHRRRIEIRCEDGGNNGTNNDWSDNFITVDCERRILAPLLTEGA